MPISGLTRLDHVGITVPDLEQARDFFGNVLGFEYLYRLGPLRGEGSWMRDHLNVPDSAIAPRIYFFRVGEQAILEVFEYEAPDQRRHVPLNSDVGGHHIAFYVDDIDTAAAELRAQGVNVLAGPTASKGPHEGQRWLYFVSPWGLNCELVSSPKGKAYFRDPDAFE
ncbi:MULTISPECIES: VOC family protein [unclassified Nocardioides]|uniref:VOC family protein n=1 Tax=unclassified Nocardioides TaxID=2615069 RepID=UPI0009EF88A6|nr:MULTISPECIES: VOC family protein [unclassified Nocardioides]GAW47972.1 glyoxalase/bleomycin resistance protein/dioxygenase [Nocardioides sp. PD653-B2]GAW53725.1 glyoxalase/bleomycin resistance protein/dioxygenase [Nocardioides sp. PD653]